MSNGPPSKTIKILWLTAGWLCFAVGVIGVVLPGLPTTGPMLMALACFSKGSEKLRNWLLDHPTFGPPLRRWNETHTIPIQAKVTAIAMMFGSMAMVCMLTPLPAWGKLAANGLILVGMIVVLRVPHATNKPQ